VLAENSYSRVLELLFRFCQLLIRLIEIKSVAEKKKKKNPKIFVEPYHQRGCIHHYSHSFIRLYSLVLVLVLVLICSCFLDQITSWDKTRLHCLD
jgi:hypothetical protein